MRSIYVSVTQLSQYTSRSGDLSSGNYGSVSGIEGTRLHQKIFADLKKQYGDSIETEYSMTGDYQYNDIDLHINGRADAIINDGTTNIVEIKSFNSTKNTFEKLVRPEHMAQLELYSFLYMDMNNLDSVDITLRYVSITSLEAFEKRETITYQQALEIYENHCTEYAMFASELMKYEVSMLSSVKNMSFPYDNIRPGQAEFMKNALLSLTSKEALFVEAPTGTGKTISTLYPAIKGLLRGKYSKIFYLTAKTATRVVALKALNDMRQKGLIIRSILLSSKENMCPYHQKCDAKYCKYSKNYYVRLRPALDEILLNDDITPDLVSQIALKHEICPHEFALDTMNYCNVVIGDYNHAFDPRVTLVRCFEEDNHEENVVLVDEAHNLVDRARNMYSCSFSQELLDSMIKVFKGIDSKTEALLSRLQQYFTLADQCMVTKQSFFAMTEEVDERKVLRTENFEGTRSIPKKFYEILWKVCRFLSPVLEDLPKGELRSTAMNFFFEARFFLTIIEQYYNDSYITYLSKENNVISMNAYCLDSSDKLNNLIRDKMAVIFFSATMSPYEYYRNVLIGKDADYCRNLSLPYPFPEENLEILINSDISTKYKDRAFTSQAIAKSVVKELSNRRGNYMIFFSSYEYMNAVSDLIEKDFCKLTSDDKIERKVLRQKSNMSDYDKKEYLSHFESPSDNLLLGTAVLGGHFGEGIDLVGDRLSGVIIVGVGVPKVTPIRQILNNYFAEKFGDGYAFAYRFPGWEKVLQAVGRVIRTEDDTGFAMLIDERLDSPEYLSLFPSHWII